MRSIIVLSGVLALALLAEPAKADPTSNTLFVVVDLGGFATDTSGQDYQYYNYEYEESPNILIFNLASIEGTFPFVDLSFAGLGEINLNDYQYFIIGEADGSEHLLLSGDGEGEGFDLDPMFEQGIVDGVTNLDDLGTLGDPGGSAFVAPGTFLDQFGVPIGTFTGPGALFDMTAATGEGMDLLGFTEGMIIGRITFNPDGTATFVPEPTLAVLTVLGIAGAAIARRRRRAAA